MNIIHLLTRKTGEESMSKMISVESGFQYSVNIGYDLNNDEKLKGFIPTKASMDLIEEILMSTNSNSTDRARILIGAYGKGKSHIVLAILSLLEKKNIKLFEKLMIKANENPELLQLIKNYYNSRKKILPIAISGSNTSLTQAFLLSLQRTLSDHNMLDVMPETNYKAAISVLERWKNDFPETYLKFENEIGMPVGTFEIKLQNFDAETYETFEQIYPKLTSGSIFNPFLGFDVVELYENAAKGLKSKGYSGVYVVYDEFSKYLEANIKSASVSDTKMLQDFAEKCNRSGELQMHLMLISHKEIANYIDKLPKQKIDGWRGVSERFKHIRLNNNSSQIYEIISTVIKKEKSYWEKFLKKYKKNFSEIIQRYSKHPIFAHSVEELNMAVFGCFPLHPVSTFILPRLSERVAQNERTLFTFLSADGMATFTNFLKSYDDTFLLITADLIYDYFESLFKKEAHGSNIYNNYILTSTILTQIRENSLGSKIVKTISLIYTLEQFERLKPTKEELIGIYSFEYDVKIIEDAISELIEKEFVVYLKRSNGFLRLKKASGVDINKKISDFVEIQESRISVKDILNEVNFDNYMYPARYNDEREMIRFFSFEFIEGKEVTDDIDWKIKSENIQADGIIYAVIPETEEEIVRLNKLIRKLSTGYKRHIFIIPRYYQEIEQTAKELNAVTKLRNKAVDDEVLLEEYETVFEDLNEIIKTYIHGYTHPEEYKSTYIYDGKEFKLHRKSALTELMSKICDKEYALTPVIINEALNRDEITTISKNSRNKIIAALLRNELEPNLGLYGTGQDVSIMRSTLIRTGIWIEEHGVPKINLKPDDTNMRNMLQTIEKFILKARQVENLSFAELYRQIIHPEYHIGLRKGLIPIYLTAVIREYKQQILIKDRFEYVPINADLITQINAEPGNFEISYLDWNFEKEKYVQCLSEIFKDFIVDAERNGNSYDYVANAMYRWFMGLPKYSKDSLKTIEGKNLQTHQLSFKKAFKKNTGSFDLLFKELPEIFGYDEIVLKIADDIAAVKVFYDNLLSTLKESLIEEVKATYVLEENKTYLKQMSLASVINEWRDSLDEGVFEQLFPDGTNRALDLFKTITNDEYLFISDFAKISTGLRLEDWDDDTRKRFTEQIAVYKNTAEQFSSEQAEGKTLSINSYEITCSDENGSFETKRFNRVDVSKRGKILYNQISSSIDSMGQSISEQEKRQILMEILKKLC